VTDTLIASRPEHCLACYRLIRAGETYHQTEENRVLCRQCAGPGQADELRDTIPVTDDLEIELSDGGLRLRRRSTGTGIILYPGELRHLVEALVEAGTQVAEAGVRSAEGNGVSAKGHGDEDRPAHVAGPKYAVCDRVVKTWNTQQGPLRVEGVVHHVFSGHPRTYSVYFEEIPGFEPKNIVIGSIKEGDLAPPEE